MLGRPKRGVSVSGGLVYAHTRDPLLASLIKEALEELAWAYDAVLVKHVPHALPDAPTKSNRIKHSHRKKLSARKLAITIAAAIFESTYYSKTQRGEDLDAVLQRLSTVPGD